MNILYILTLEPIETRYTSQWAIELPKIIEKYIEENKLQYEVVSIFGDLNEVSNSTTEGAFLNFIDTNIWKNTQINKFLHLVKNDKIKNGDKVLFPDAWHTGIIQLRYVFDLLKLNVEIHSLWHAGSYDPNDFLGRLIEDKNWSFSIERASFHASTKNYFATSYHKVLFNNTLFHKIDFINKSFVVGFPFDYLEETLKPYKNLQKKDRIIFPHRLAPEKQVEIFDELAKEMPEYEFVVCQRQKLTKHEYYTLLGESKIVFSANTQETLGISIFEGLLLDVVPFVPSRLSYNEMYFSLYYSIWSESFQSFLHYKNDVISSIKNIIGNYEKYIEFIRNTNLTVKKFFNSTSLLNEIFK